MSNISRTTNSLRNAKVSIMFYILNLALTFVSRKAFIEHLGVEVLGLNTTASNLLGILNLAELGISNAVSFSLYKPLLNNDRNTINEIISLQSYWYRKIGILIITSSLVLIFFFPLIFSNISIPFWYTYSTFLVLLTSSLLSYFFNYKQIILIADQKDYKVTIIVQGWRSVKILTQILLITFTIYGYIFWLITEIIFAVLSTYYLSKEINKVYPWLFANPRIGNLLQKKYKELTLKIKQLFFHKVSGFILLQTSPLILFAYSSLTLVAIYGNYLLVISGFSLFINAVYNSANSSIGNLVAENEKSKMLNIFWELFSFRFIVVSISCLTAYLITTPIINYWFGGEFVLSNTTVILIVSIMFFNTMRGVVDAFINAFGLFKDVWATVTESILNISFSIILGYYFGLNGILTGILISLFPAILVWKPYFCFSYGFKTSSFIFFKNILHYLILAFTSIIASFAIMNVLLHFFSIKRDSLLGILIHVSIYSIFISVSMYFTSPATSRLIKRFKERFLAEDDGTIL